MLNLPGLSRRQWLRLSAGALLVAGWPGALGATEPDAGAFSFFALNDLHFTDAGCTPLFARQRGSTVLTTHRCRSLRCQNNNGTKGESYSLCRAQAQDLTRTLVEMPLTAAV